jgi:hypothetical protein
MEFLNIIEKGYFFSSLFINPKNKIKKYNYFLFFSLAYNIIVAASFTLSHINISYIQILRGVAQQIRL